MVLAADVLPGLLVLTDSEQNVKIEMREARRGVAAVLENLIRVSRAATSNLRARFPGPQHTTPRKRPQRKEWEL